MKNYKLSIDAEGRLRGNANITYNDKPPYGYAWPCVNGTPGGGAGSMMGVVMHTEVGYEQGTIATFNNPASQASAFFALGRDGAIWQFGPVGADWMAWTQADGNPNWYGIEDTDNTHPSIPLTAAQVMAFAQILECLSAFAGFPLQVSNSTSVQGLGWHGMGGVPWGDHPDCPGDVRKAQRPAIVALAKQIRNPVKPTVWAIRPFVCDGTISLTQVCARFGNSSGPVLWRTFRGVALQSALLAYVSRLNFSAPLPAGTVLMLREAVAPAAPANRSAA